jgi:hypothetical protein
MEGNGAKSMRFALGTIYHRLRSLGAKAKTCEISFVPVGLDGLC